MSNKIEQNDKNTLFYCEVCKPYKIVRCNLNGQLKKRLFEMGLVPDTRITVIKRAPLGDPLQIAVRGYSLCVRGAIAKQFVVEEAD